MHNLQYITSSSSTSLQRNKGLYIYLCGDQILAYQTYTMGKGGEKVSGYNTRLRRVPHEKPPFTLGDIKKAIPNHCFNRSLFLSFSWLIFDLSACFIIYHIATTYIPLLPNSLAWLAWTTYACVQGSFVTALWIIGHECNHNAFSDYYWLNDTIGFILHSLVLHPYFSFKISHRLHHANTSSLQREENHVPRFKQTLRVYNFKNPMARMLGAPLYLAVGWPLYMTINMAGRTYDGFASHFYPYSPIFNKRERVQVVVSDIGVLATCYGLYYIATVKGLTWLLLVYGAPLFVYGGHFVLISLLHHTHPSLPRYDSSEWDWMRGTLATVDRDYGIFNKLFHNVTNTHVLHHLFTTIPHYHVQEATEAIKPILGDYYLYDPTPVYKAFWREVKECLYVEEDEGENASKGVYWFKNTTT